MSVLASACAQRAHAFGKCRAVDVQNSVGRASAQSDPHGADRVWVRGCHRWHRKQSAIVGGCQR
eukprot:3950726-Alexandrium_andersonii.AAC.1